jgi:hypothetical protein
MFSVDLFFANAGGSLKKNPFVNPVEIQGCIDRHKIDYSAVVGKGRCAAETVDNYMNI